MEPRKGVMGIIKKENKILLGIEAKDTPYHGMWRLLGGKLEGNETHAEAMIRETKEEADIDIKVINFIGRVKGTLNDVMIDICVAEWIEGEIKPNAREFKELRWFTLEEAKPLKKDHITEQFFEAYEKSQL